MARKKKKFSLFGNPTENTKVEEKTTKKTKKVKNKVVNIDEPKLTTDVQKVSVADTDKKVTPEVTKEVVKVKPAVVTKKEVVKKLIAKKSINYHNGVNLFRIKKGDSLNKLSEKDIAYLTKRGIL